MALGRRVVEAGGKDPRTTGLGCGFSGSTGRNAVLAGAVRGTPIERELAALREKLEKCEKDAEPVAWLIEGEDAHPDGWGKFRTVYLHNAIADYRDRDPKATSTPLYK